MELKSTNSKWIDVCQILVSHAQVVASLHANLKYCSNDHPRISIYSGKLCAQMLGARSCALMALQKYGIFRARCLEPGNAI